MRMSMVKGIGSYLHALAAFSPLTFTAGTAGTGTDEVIQHGIGIDRFSIDQKAESGIFVITALTASLGPATANITARVMDSADGVTYANYGPAVAATQWDTNGMEVITVPVRLSGARRFIRVSLTAGFSATSVDTVVASAVLILGGLDETPVTENLNPVSV